MHARRCGPLAANESQRTPGSLAALVDDPTGFYHFKSATCLAMGPKVDRYTMGGFAPMIRRLPASGRLGPRLACTVVLGLLGAVTGTWAQGFYNMELLSQTDEFAGGRGAYASCWGYTAPDGTELAIIGTVNGTAIYDVSDPRRPVQVASIDGPRSQWREMQTWSHYCYVVTEGVGARKSVV